MVWIPVDGRGHWQRYCIAHRGRVISSLCCPLLLPPVRTVVPSARTLESVLRSVLLSSRLVVSSASSVLCPLTPSFLNWCIFFSPFSTLCPDLSLCLTRLSIPVSIDPSVYLSALSTRMPGRLSVCPTLPSASPSVCLSRLSTRLSVRLSFRPLTHLPICPLCSTCLHVCSSVCPPVCPSFRLSTCLSTCPPVCLSVYLSFCPPACPPACRSMSFHMSTCLSICLSACLSSCPPVCPSLRVLSPPTPPTPCAYPPPHLTRRRGKATGARHSEELTVGECGRGMWR